MPNKRRVAYFSMEIALDPAIPTYSGGLGVLAGDMLRSAADLGVPVIGISLLHRKGYFRQRIDERGIQAEEPEVWNPQEVLVKMEPLIDVTIEGRVVAIRAWQYLIQGHSGHTVPVYLLDTALSANTPWDQSLTDSLYGGDDRYRFCQEVVLGIGGVELLRSLGEDHIENFHMNEGHSALLSLALLEQVLEGRDLSSVTEQDVEAVRRKCIFTTHTPVPAGHDQFPRELVFNVLGEKQENLLQKTRCSSNGGLNMTYLALRFSHYINGVAMQHGEVSRDMFPRYPISAITNGVHAVTWVSPPFQELFDKHVPEWRHDNLYLRYVIGIPTQEIREAHLRAKRALLEEVKKRTEVSMDETVMTVGFARRASTYKRADLLFFSPERLKYIAQNVGPFQLIFAGKAHPYDEGGKGVIRRVFDAAAALKDIVKFVYLENYDMHWGQLITSGVDLWLNTPKRPQEASGTSGMKAALNGVPSLSVLDGWWIEGHVEGFTGWAVGHGPGLLEDNYAEAASLYEKLELIILPMFYGRPLAFAKVMRSAIALNGSFFNTQRMVSQYVSNAYTLDHE
ncbi:MAG: alpha-glucan family phosphorylase [Terriglobia bacterium]